MPKAIDLFEAVRLEAALHPSFRNMRDSPLWTPARAVLRDLFSDFSDPDGNFVEQFQTSGFDARTFEIYLFALFKEAGFSIDRSLPRPDFILQKDGEQIAVEAVTANRPASIGIKPYVPQPIQRDADELRTYMKNEVPIRLGSPMFSKLQKKYWELEHVRDRPFVLAIEDFHEGGSLAISSTPLAEYLYGLNHHWYHNNSGELIITTSPSDAHRLGAKEIPSGFFKQPDAENISAVLFSNSGTAPKFNRMGQEGILRSGAVRMIRYGTCYRHDPNADKPATFVYEVGDGETNEKWNEGTVLIHNPYARYPIKPGLMGVSAEETFQNGINMTTFFDEGFHPFSSLTMHFPGHTPTAYLQEVAHTMESELLKLLPE
jgi:hypothetical protein